MHGNPVPTNKRDYEASVCFHAPTAIVADECRGNRNAKSKAHLISAQQTNNSRVTHSLISHLQQQKPSKKKKITGKKRISRIQCDAYHCYYYYDCDDYDYC